MGYDRVETAEERGQFAVRGGVLDVFPSDGHIRYEPSSSAMRSRRCRRYVPSTGQTIGDAGPTEVFTCREVTLSTRAAGRVEKALRHRALQEPEIAHHLELIQDGVYFNGVESYMPFSMTAGHSHRLSSARDADRGGRAALALR